MQAFPLMSCSKSFCVPFVFGVLLLQHHFCISVKKELDLSVAARKGNLLPLKRTKEGVFEGEFKFRHLCK